MLGEGEGRSSPGLRSKVLSLQLLLHLLQNSGRVFQTSDMFVSAIKKYLVLALCTNALYAYVQVTELTLRIFLLLLTVFPANLKAGRAPRCAC
jgi:brefeldin A-inhibited guanine nucleotide-exchange protein